MGFNNDTPDFSQNLRALYTQILKCKNAYFCKNTNTLAEEKFSNIFLEWRVLEICKDIFSELHSKEIKHFYSIVSKLKLEDIPNFVRSCYVDKKGNPLIYLDKGGMVVINKGETIFDEKLSEYGGFLGDTNSESFKLFLRVQIIMSGNWSKFHIENGTGKEMFEGMKFQEIKSVAEYYMYPDVVAKIKEFKKNAYDLHNLYANIEEKKNKGKISKPSKSHFAWMKEKEKITTLFKQLVLYQLIEDDNKKFQSLFSINDSPLSDYSGKVKWVAEKIIVRQIAHLFHLLAETGHINKSQQRKINGIIIVRICNKDGNSNFLQHISKTYSLYKKSLSETPSEEMKLVEKIVSSL